MTFLYQVKRYYFAKKRGMPLYQEVVSLERNLKLGPWPQCDCQSSHDMFLPESRLHSSFNNCILPWASWLFGSLQTPPLKIGAVRFASQGRLLLFSSLPYFWGTGQEEPSWNGRESAFVGKSEWFPGCSCGTHVVHRLCSVASGSRVLGMHFLVLLEQNILWPAAEFAILGSW